MQWKTGRITQVVIWVLVVVAVGLLIYGLAVLGSGSTSLSPSSSSQTTTTGIRSEDHVEGNKNAKTVLIEYGDFQCPSCGQTAPLVKQLAKNYPNDLAIVFRNFPLSIHKNAYPASRAAEAAAQQNKYWEMVDVLFTNQSVWSEVGNPGDVFAGYAKTLGMDVEKFKKDSASDSLKTKIEGDIDLAQAAQVNATPTFFLNGKKMQITSFQGFMDSVAQAVNAAGGSGTPTNSTTK